MGNMKFLKSRGALMAFSLFVLVSSQCISGNVKSVKASELNDNLFDKHIV